MGKSNIDPVSPILEDELPVPQSVQSGKGPDQSSVMPDKSDTEQESVCRPAGSNVRLLSEEEIERLQHRLGRPVDRDYLIRWVSRAIRDVVRLWGDPARPTLRQRPDSLVKIATVGRRWIETANTSPGLSQLGRELDDVKGALARLCHRAELLAKEIRVKRGNQPSTVAVLTFIGQLIGIAKVAKVYPSSESRELRSETAPRDPPDFFLFVVEALEIAAHVIESSALSEGQKYAAVSVLAVPSRGALSKLIEQARGQISDYHDSEHGLVSRRMCDPNRDETS